MKPFPRCKGISHIIAALLDQLRFTDAEYMKTKYPKKKFGSTTINNADKAIRTILQVIQSTRFHHNSFLINKNTFKKGQTLKMGHEIKSNKNIYYL